jgi:phosphoribosylglycinamide formyltransferase-1
MVKKKTCVFISGKGSNLKNLIYRSRDSSFPIKISLVISNNKRAKGINLAKKYKIPYILINTKTNNYEFKILKKLKK